MIKQERKYTLAEVHTNVGTMGEVRFDEAFMQVLGVKPGDSVSFLIDADGAVTVKKRARGITTIHSARSTKTR